VRCSCNACGSVCAAGNQLWQAGAPASGAAGAWTSSHWEDSFVDEQGLPSGCGHHALQCLCLLGLGPFTLARPWSRPAGLPAGQYRHADVTVYAEPGAALVWPMGSSSRRWTGAAECAPECAPLLCQSIAWCTKHPSSQIGTAPGRSADRHIRMLWNDRRDSRRARTTGGATLLVQGLGPWEREQ